MLMNIEHMNKNTLMFFTPKTNQFVTMKTKSKQTNTKYLTKTPNPKINQLK